MSETGKKKTLSLGGGERLGLLKSGEGAVAPSRGGMGGGRKTVKVEVRRRRAPARPGQSAEAAGAAAKGQVAAADPVAIPTTVAKSAAAPPQGAPATAEAGAGRARHLLRTLSSEEKSARPRALDNAFAADDVARARAV